VVISDHVKKMAATHFDPP